MVLTNVINPRSAVSRKNEFKTTLIKKGASIGANATIVCGNTIGNFAFIGAGTVVTKDVPDYALVIGNPGRQTGWMSEYGQKLQFNENNIAICEESKQEYILENNVVKRLIK
jgi:UDP-2-acetamido-3-amino-2,3-dideoxy-glucuronate N-acetyltransferase